ncbi:trichohyalin-like isoform X3 [Mercenaria mercenaria]|uniref:trichohyalin-like isoform X3 n=1 Tax=Mercenaria mercenaria TaxID=6596 RepID=UPI00234E8BB2|nr:trichohyalin-like isoform X3 [Mercenaria mercenaria]
MNYSVFKLQNQAGRPAIFWEKDLFGFPTVPRLLPNIETVPKKDRKFGYKKNDQRFPIRKFPNDRHHIDTDLVSLTPDEPHPPPKPAKNFIKRNKEKVAPKAEPPSTVTLTQEQLNAILRSVGKVAGGSENAVKITVDKHNDTKEIVVESPRRHDRDDDKYDDDDDDDYDDRKERRRKKKSNRKQEDQSNSIYSLMEGKNKPKATSDTESINSDGSLELRRLTRQYKRRKDRKSRRQEEDDEEEDRHMRDKNRRNKNTDIDDDDNLREKRHRRNRSNNLQDEIDREIAELRRHNKSKHSRDVDNDSDNEKENRRRRTRSKRRESDDEEFDKDYDRKERTKKSDHSKDVKGMKSRNRSEERDLDFHNTSSNKENEELLPSPRDKIGLPTDLSWRHMTKAERRRLEMARQKLTDEEERKEEERIKHLNAQYDPGESFKKPPQRHVPTRSDPPATRQTRYDRGRETENTNYTDGNRHGRRSRSPSDQRSPDRSPDLPSYTTPDTSPKAPVGIPRRHMTLAEKKRLEWERERVESVQMERVGNFDPWGRPGAGAPIRTRSGHVVADYKGRQDQMHSDAIPEEEPSTETGKQKELSTRPQEKRRPARGKSPPPQAPQPDLDKNIPITMRSSFVLGQAAPDYDKLTSAKERERKQWLADLERQIEEKRQMETKQKETKTEDTWADKFGQSHRPMPFPEQPRETGLGDKLNTSTDHVGALLETARVQSAPEGDQVDNSSYIRGQNAPIDPVTKKELEEKRKRYLEHQAAVKAQVEEKERLKRMERERKMKEDMEEERKLQEERQVLQKQFDMEQQKIKQKEQQRQAQVNQLKAAMDEAQAKALQEKYQRKMQHLEAGGHDTKKLREHLEGEITSRIEQLHTRRERDILRARQLLELQHWGVTIAEEDEENQSQVPAEQPKDAKITPRDESVTGMETSHIPGLDLSTARTHFPPQMPTTRRDQSQGHYSQAQGHSQGHYGQGQSQPHEPYTEDRVLTPSRFRHPSKPWSDPGSPRREFGTQTGDELSQLLNPRLQRDYSEVNIEYRYEKGKKVRVISAPKEALEKRSRKLKQPHPPPSYREHSRSPHEHHHEVRNKIEKEENSRKKRLELQRRKGPVKPGSRPMWGYKNPDSKKPKKQSERDPFYEQKKRESEMRRLKREHKLLAMVEANKPVIPDYYVPPPKSSRSRSRDLSPLSDLEMASPREVRPSRRSKSHSPNRLVLQGEIDHSYGHQNEGKSPDRRRNQNRSPSPRGRRESPTQDRTVDNLLSRTRNTSPPIPALRHRSDANQNVENDTRNRKGGKYGDRDPLDVPIPNGDFVPFTRTVDILDPTKAEEPVPLSREATRVANARRAYYEGLHPEKFGNRQYVFQDKHRVLPAGDDGGKNPLMNPSLVLDHPTTRQDQILVQLSTLKQSLMQRQRELETFSPTDLYRMDTDIKA